MTPEERLRLHFGPPTEESRAIFNAMVQAIIAEEREACAKVAEGYEIPGSKWKRFGNQIARAIRARA